MANSIYTILGVHLDTINRFIEVSPEGEITTKKPTDFPEQELSQIVKEQKVLFENLIQLLKNPSEIDKEDQKKDPILMKARVLFSVAQQKIEALQAAAQYKCRIDGIVALEEHSKKFQTIAAIRRQSFAKSRESAILEQQKKEHVRHGSKTAEDVPTKIFAASRPMSALVKSLSDEGKEHKEGEGRPGHKKERSRSFQALEVPQKGEGEAKGPPLKSLKQLKEGFSQDDVAMYFENLGLKSPPLPSGRPISVMAISTPPKEGAPLPKHSVGKSGKDAVSSSSSKEKLPEKKVISKAVAGLQKSLDENQTQFRRVLESLDASDIRTFQNQWSKVKEITEEILKKLLSESQSKDLISSQLKLLKTTPLLGLSCEIMTARTLASFPRNPDSWAEDVDRQLPYIQIEGTDNVALSIVPKESLKSFQEYTDRFRTILTGIVKAIPASDKLKLYILEEYNKRVSEIDQSNLNGDSVSECFRKFLTKFAKRELFLPSNLDTFSLQDGYLLNCIGDTVVHLLHASYQDSYITPALLVMHQFKELGWNCNLIAGIKGGRSVTYAFGEKGGVTVKGRCLIEVAKPGQPQFTIAVENTLSAFIPTLPKWESAIKVEIVKKPDDNHQFSKKNILIPLLKAGFFIDWPASE